MRSLAVYTLWLRELVRFLRQPSRLLSALGTPLIFWLLVGSGLTASFRMPEGAREMSFLEYFFPGTLVLLVMFASIFANISVIEDRHEGFLQAVMASPVGGVGLVLGKVLGATSLSWLQGAVFLVLAPLAGLPLGVGSTLLALAVLLLLALGLAALGFAMAWKVDSTQGFHGVMNLLLIPMWMLSGAFFPAAGAPSWLAGLMRVNPLTYGTAALRRALYPPEALLGERLPELSTSLIVMAATALLGIALALGVAGRRS